MTRLRAHELSPRSCGHCGETFTPREGSKGIYCSMVCARFGVSRATATRRGDALRGRGVGKTYRKRNGRHEHRVVAEETLGRELLPGEVVHHIDGNKNNNDPENLEVLTQAEHMQRHGLAIPGVAPAWQPWTARHA